METKPSIEEQTESFIAITKAYIEQLRGFKARFEAIDQVTGGDYFSNLENASYQEKRNERGDLFTLNRDFSEAFLAFNSQATEYNDVLALTPWLNEAHFVHNIGSTQYHCFGSITDSFFFRQREGKELKQLLSNISFFIEQIICHLQSIILSLKEPEEESSVQSSVIEALRIVLRSRLFYGGLRIPGISDDMKESPRAIILGDSSLSSNIPIAELVELCYVPVSNAHRIMGKEEDPSALRLEIITREIQYQGEKLLVLEFFSTGKQVDITALQEALLKANEDHIKTVAPHALPVIRAVKQGSRQAQMNLFEDALLIEGITLTTGGTGLGLNDLNRHVELRNGAVLLNNTYGPEKGFCTTLILPQDHPVDPNSLKRTLRELKEKLQKGKYFLETPQSNSTQLLSS